MPFANAEFIVSGNCRDQTGTLRVLGSWSLAGLLWVWAVLLEVTHLVAVVAFDLVDVEGGFGHRADAVGFYGDVLGNLDGSEGLDLFWNFLGVKH